MALLDYRLLSVLYKCNNTNQLHFSMRLYVTAELVNVLLLMYHLYDFVFL